MWAYSLFFNEKYVPRQIIIFFLRIDQQNEVQRILKLQEIFTKQSIFETQTRPSLN